jgi:hypothetical protein
LAGDPDAALVWAEKACALSEALGAPEVRGPALQSRGTARCDRGDLGGLDDFRASLDLALNHGLAAQAAFSYNNLAEHLGRTEGPAIALDTYRAGIELADRRGIVEAAMWMRAESSRPLFDLGSWDELLRVSGQVIEWDRARAGRYVTALAEPLRARALLYRDRLPGAAAVAEELVVRCREIGDLQVVLPAFVTAVLIRLRRGDLDGAAGLVGELLETTFAATGSQWDLIQHLPDLTRVCVAVDKVEPAQHLLERTRAAAARDHHCLVAAHAVLAEARADLEQASTRYEDAADRWARFGVVVEHGHVLLGLGGAWSASARLKRASGWPRRARYSPGLTPAGWSPRPTGGFGGYRPGRDAGCRKRRDHAVGCRAGDHARTGPRPRSRPPGSWTGAVRVAVRAASDRMMTATAPNTVLLTRSIVSEPPASGRSGNATHM